MKNMIFLFMAFLPLQIFSQMTGEVNYKELGIRFTIPNGWIGQESGEGLIMGSNTDPGLIFMLQHEYKSLEEMKKETENGIEDDGVSLQRNGNFEVIGKNGIGAEFSGNIQNQAAKAYIIGMINPYGAGITIMAATESAKYSPKYKQWAMELAQSVQFSKVETPPLVLQWKQELKNKKLSYLYTYSSSTNGYSGMSEKEEMWLCAAGYFQYKSNSHNTFDTSGASGYSNNNQKGGGTWDVVPDGAGNPVLKLSFQDGTAKTYRIDGIKDGKFYMSGYRYFKTDGGNMCN